MKVTKLPIEGVLLIEPQIFGDARGWFYETYNEERYRAAGICETFVQDNQSFSQKNVVRGLHFQKPPFTQAKLVSVIQGAVLDVAVDLRAGSPTYGQYVSAVLTGENHHQLFVPKGFAHGFVVLSDEAVFQYKCDEYYHPEAENGIAWDDKELNITWPIQPQDIILSNKDRNRQSYYEYTRNGE